MKEIHQQLHSGEKCKMKVTQSCNYHFKMCQTVFIKAVTIFSFSFFVKTRPFSWTSLVAQTVKGLPTMQETRFQSLGREEPLGKEMETHCSILAWKIPWTEEPGRLQSMGSQRVGQTVFIRTFTVFRFSFFKNTSFFLEKTFTNK